MKITAFNGSPRAEKSNTQIMLEAFLEGARDAGAQTETVFLAKKSIRHCTGCFACWTKTPGRCVLKDDMAELLELYRGSDIVVLACPIYTGTVTGLMKDFLDRSIPLADPHFKKSAQGLWGHVERYERLPETVILSNCGFPEQEHFRYFRSCFQYLSDIGGMKIIAEVYRGGGEILSVDSLLLKPLLYGYKRTLRKAGREVAEKRALSAALKEELEKPLIPPDRYIEEANKYWDKLLAKVPKSS
ncbi:MAG TPA: flavodoxin family protein [Elusimicrobia bacterium]|nr:flavodoxin family protein [Elusimicrobiota bacterium]